MQERVLVMYKIDNALKLLKIDTKKLTPTYIQLTGTRHIIQFETPDYSFSMSKTFKPDILAYGVTNRCADGFFVFFAEYDGIYKDLVYKNLRALLKKYPNEFTNFYIAKTEETKLKNGKYKGNYHVVSFSKHFKHEIKEYLDLMDVDNYFRVIPEKTAHKTQVLRLSEKYFVKGKKIAKQEPKFTDIFPKQQINACKTISEPHYKLFKKHWGFKDKFKLNLDGEKKIELHKFKTTTKRRQK